MTCDGCRHHLAWPHEVSGKPCQGWCTRYPQWVAKNTTTPRCGEYKLPKKEARQKKLTEYSAEFLRFWQAYPKKGSQDDAWRAWQYDPSHHAELVIKRADAYARYVKTEGKDMQYIKLPATWLNKGDWRTEIVNKNSGKDCCECNAPYEQGKGFKYTGLGKNLQYRCAACSKARNEA